MYCAKFCCYWQYFLDEDSNIQMYMTMPVICRVRIFFVNLWLRLIYKMLHIDLFYLLIRFFTAEIICGLRFLHGNGIVHRDLKTDNILLDSTGHVKIADFGLSAIDLAGSKAFSSMVGTPSYTAPEVSIGTSWFPCLL